MSESRGIKTGVQGKELVEYVWKTGNAKNNLGKPEGIAVLWHVNA